MIYKGFLPFFDENSEILILGSFPSVISRETNFYYGNKQNRFWKILSEAFGDCPLRAASVLSLLYVSQAIVLGFLPRQVED